MAEIEPISTNGNLMDRSNLVLQVAAPISDEAPAGEKVTYDDDFQRVKMEVDKLASASASGVDFELVVELATKILTEKSKDLTAATFLAMGLTRTDGLAGAAEGVAVIRLLLENFWEQLFPPLKRARARRNALQALSDRLKEWVAAEEPEMDDREALEHACEDMQAIQSFVLETMGENAPAVSGLTRAFEAALRKVPEPEPEPEPEEPSTSSSSSDGTTADAGTSTAPAGGSAASSPPAGTVSYRSEREAQRAVYLIADFLRKEDQASPVPYRVARGVGWGRLDEEPPSTDGKTLVAAPESHRRTYLDGLLERREFETLLEEAEQSFRESPMWLDLQRYVIVAMEAQGHRFIHAREGVLYDLAALLQKLPNLVRLRFADGTPMANSATQEWVEMQVSPLYQQEGQAGGATGESEGDDGLHERFEQARAKLVGNDLAGALALMTGEGGTESSPRAHFRRRLFEAILCMKGGSFAVARPILEGLAERIDHHDLARWDPDLALEVWTQLYACYGALAGSDEEEKREIQHRSDRLFERICDLDPRRALDLEHG